MEIMHGSKFKVIYTDWYIHRGERRPFGNAIHPVIREFIQHVYKNNLNIDPYRILQYGPGEKGIKFDHSEILNYFYRNFPNNIVSSNQIQDDDFTYIYPLEVKDTLSALNKHNSFYLNDEKYMWYLKDIIPNKILKDCKSGKVKLLISIIHDPLYDDNNIRRFEIQMNRLGIDGSNIIFLGGSKFTEYYEKHPESKVKIYNGHLFIRAYADMMKEFPTTGSLGYICELVDVADLDINNIRPYKFLCNNKTMTKEHRATMAYFAIKYDLLKEGMFSFIQKLDKDTLYSQISKIIKNPNEEYVEKIAEILPYELDTKHLSSNEKTNFGATNNMKNWYSDTYVNLVTETFFGKNVFLSEKIFKPLSNLQPFIVLGDYGTLAELKRLGFKTFEPFIDESYDLEIESKSRIDKIEIEIEKLKNKSIEEIHQWYYSIKDILIHNQKHLYSFENYECFDEILGKIKLDYEKQTTWNLQEKKLL
jgi:hypothetical protein